MESNLDWAGQKGKMKKNNQKHLSSLSHATFLDFVQFWLNTLTITSSSFFAVIFQGWEWRTQIVHPTSFVLFFPRSVQASKQIGVSS